MAPKPSILGITIPNVRKMSDKLIQEIPLKPDISYIHGYHSMGIITAALLAAKSNTELLVAREREEKFYTINFETYSECVLKDNLAPLQRSADCVIATDQSSSVVGLAIAWTIRKPFYLITKHAQLVLKTNFRNERYGLLVHGGLEKFGGKETLAKSLSQSLNISIDQFPKMVIDISSFPTGQKIHRDEFAGKPVMRVGRGMPGIWFDANK